MVTSDLNVITIRTQRIFTNKVRTNFREVQFLTVVTLLNSLGLETDMLNELFASIAVHPLLYHHISRYTA